MTTRESVSSDRGHERRGDEPTAPYLLRMAAGWSWRVLVVFAAFALLVLLFARVNVLALSLLGALLVTALLRPLDVMLRDRLRFPSALAALLTVLLFLALLAGVGIFVSNQAASQTDQLTTSVSSGVDEVQKWLTTGPLNLNPERIATYRQQIVDALNNNRGRIANGVLSGATIALEVVTALILALFAIFFFLKDGEGLWTWITRLFNPSVRNQVDETGRRAWGVLTAYVRGVVVIAAADAVFIGIALYAVGVPLVVPLALLTFFAAFVPIVGAFVAGFVSVLVALVSKGFISAVIILVAIVVIQQIEGNVLHPIVMKRAVSVHPLVSVFAVTAGTTLAGIGGAVVAVPLIAVGNEVVRYLASLRRRDVTAPQPGEERGLGGDGTGSVPADTEAGDSADNGPRDLGKTEGLPEVGDGSRRTAAATRSS